MQQEANPRTLMFALLLTMLISSCLVHSSNLANSPSPSLAVVGMPMPNEPPRRIVKKGRRGSFPATCHLKCNQCEPCMPVQVSVRAMALEENECYPQVWKCSCGDNIFSP
ncbi:hypothetical protein ACE6H2_027534 [Prunus campanulata]